MNYQSFSLERTVTLQYFYSLILYVLEFLEMLQYVDATKACFNTTPGDTTLFPVNTST